MKFHFFSRCPEASLRRENFRLIAVNKELTDKIKNMRETLVSLEQEYKKNLADLDENAHNLIVAQQLIEELKSKPKPRKKTVQE